MYCGEFSVRLRSWPLFLLLYKKKHANIFPSDRTADNLVYINVCTTAQGDVLCDHDRIITRDKEKQKQLLLGFFSPYFTLREVDRKRGAEREQRGRDTQKKVQQILFTCVRHSGLHAHIGYALFHRKNWSMCPKTTLK